MTSGSAFVVTWRELTPGELARRLPLKPFCDLARQIEVRVTINKACQITMWPNYKRIKPQAVVSALLVLALFSPLFAATRHFVPSGQARYITLDHRLRRELTRAERETLRSGALIGDAGPAIDPPHEALEAPPSPAVAVAYFTNSLFPKTTIDPVSHTADLSPVLNL